MRSGPYGSVLEQLIARRQIFGLDPRRVARDRLDPDLVDRAVEEVGVGRDSACAVRSRTLAYTAVAFKPSRGRAASQAVREGPLRTALEPLRRAASRSFI